MKIPALLISVDAPEAVERFLDVALSGFGLRNVALDCVHVSRVRRGDGKEVADAVAARGIHAIPAPILATRR
jgi:hypothetical protein